MPISLAVTSILCLALCFWAFHVSRHPRDWRLRWLDLLGVLDVDTSREQRRTQERHIALMGNAFLIAFAAATLSCVFWTVDQIREQRREKTPVEREFELTRREIEAVKERVTSRRGTP